MTGRKSASKDVRIPVWLIAILASIMVTVLGTIFYAGRTYGDVQGMNERIKRIESGVDQLWQRAVVGPVQ